MRAMNFTTAKDELDQEYESGGLSWYEYQQRLNALYEKYTMPDDDEDDDGYILSDIMDDDGDNLAGPGIYSRRKYDD